jgi:hypothetical protein
VEAVEAGGEIIAGAREFLTRGDLEVTRSATPAAAARCRACSIEAAWLSKPANVERGYCWAIRMVEAPWPQPMSATHDPASSFSTTPSRAGSQALTRLPT